MIQTPASIWTPPTFRSTSITIYAHVQYIFFLLRSQALVIELVFVMVPVNEVSAVRNANAPASTPAPRPANSISPPPPGPGDNLEMTTRSGRRLTLPALTPNSNSRRDRKATVSSEWHKIVRSARFRDLVRLSATASSPESLASTELKLWNIRHGFAPEGSGSRGSLKGFLVGFLGGSGGGSWPALLCLLSGNANFIQKHTRPLLNPTVIQTAQVLSACSCRDATHFNNPCLAPAAALKASGRPYHPKHDPDTQRAIDRVVAEYEAENGPQDRSPASEGLPLKNAVPGSVPAARPQAGAFTSCALGFTTDQLSSIPRHQ